VNSLLVRLLVKCAIAKDMEANRKLVSDFHYLNFFPQITTQDLLELEYFMLDQLGMRLSEQRRISFQDLLWLQRRHQKKLDDLAREHLVARIGRLASGAGQGRRMRNQKLSVLRDRATMDPCWRRRERLFPNRGACLLSELSYQSDLMRRPWL